MLCYNPDLKYLSSFMIFINDIIFIQPFTPGEAIPVNRNVVEMDIQLFGDVPYRIRLSVKACFKEGASVTS